MEKFFKLGVDNTRLTTYNKYNKSRNWLVENERG